VTATVRVRVTARSEAGLGLRVGIKQPLLTAGLGSRKIGNASETQEKHWCVYRAILSGGRR